MATLSERLALIVDFNGTQAVKGFEGIAKQSDQAQDKWTKASSSLTKIGAAGLAASGVAAIGLGKLASGASDLNEVTSKSRVLFGDASKGVEEFASSAAKSLGQSKASALEAATQFAAMGQAAGFTGQKLAGFSTDLVKLSGDLASFSNTTPEEAVIALGAALRGESEPIRKYGVLLDDATLKNRAMKMGLIDTTTGTLPPAIKVQAAYAEILAQTTSAQGDFARTSGGAANQQRILSAELKNLADGIGTGVLPMFTGLVSGAAEVIGKLNDMGPSAKTALGALAGGATGIVAAVSGVSLVSGQLMKLRDRFTEVTDAGRVLTTAGKVAVGAAVGVGIFTTAVTLMQMESQKGKQAVSDLEAVMAKTGDTAEKAANRQLLEWVLQNKEAKKFLDEHGVSLDDLTGAMDGNKDAAGRVAAAVKDVAGSNSKEAGAAGELVRKLAELGKARDTELGKTKAQKVAADTLVPKVQAETHETELHSAKIKDMAMVDDILAEKAAKAAKALEEQAKRDEAAAKYAEDAAKAINDQYQATQDLYGTTLDLDEKLLHFNDKINDLKDAHIATAKAAKEHGKNSKEFADAQINEADKVRDVQRAIIDVGNTAVTAAQQKKTAAGGGDLTLLERYEAQKGALIDLEGQYPEAKGAIDLYMATALDPLIAKQTDVGRTAKEQADKAILAWRNADGQITATADHIAGEGAYSKPAAALAPGSTQQGRGGNSVGGVFIQPGQAGVTAGGTAGVFITVNALTPHQAATAVVDAIKAFERTNGASWRGA